MRDPTEKRLRYWTIILALAGPLVVFLSRVLMNILPDSFLVPSFLLVCAALVCVVVIWIGVAFFDLLAVVTTVYERAWRRALSSAIFLAVILATGVNLALAWHGGKPAGDYARFFILYPKFLADIDKLPTGQPRLMAWGWDATMTHELGIAYDESDEIASVHPTEAWQQRAKQAGIAGHGYRPLYGHFYLVDLE
jgi:hypothetical protein